MLIILYGMIIGIALIKLCNYETAYKMLSKFLNYNGRNCC